MRRFLFLSVFMALSPWALEAVSLKLGNYCYTLEEIQSGQANDTIAEEITRLHDFMNSPDLTEMSLENAFIKLNLLENLNRHLHGETLLVSLEGTINDYNALSQHDNEQLTDGNLPYTHSGPAQTSYVNMFPNAYQTSTQGLTQYCPGGYAQPVFIHAPYGNVSYYANLPLGWDLDRQLAYSEWALTRPSFGDSTFYNDQPFTENRTTSSTTTIPSHYRDINSLSASHTTLPQGPNADKGSSWDMPENYISRLYASQHERSAENFSSSNPEHWLNPYDQDFFGSQMPEREQRFPGNNSIVSGGATLSWNSFPWQGDSSYPSSTPAKPSEEYVNELMQELAPDLCEEIRQTLVNTDTNTDNDYDELTRVAKEREAILTTSAPQEARNTRDSELQNLCAQRVFNKHNNQPMVSQAFNPIGNFFVKPMKKNDKDKERENNKLVAQFLVHALKSPTVDIPHYMEFQRIKGGVTALEEDKDLDLLGGEKIFIRKVLHMQSTFNKLGNNPRNVLLSNYQALITQQLQSPNTMDLELQDLRIQAIYNKQPNILSTPEMKGLFPNVTPLKPIGEHDKERKRENTLIAHFLLARLKIPTDDISHYIDLQRIKSGIKALEEDKELDLLNGEKLFLEKVLSMRSRVNKLKARPKRMLLKKYQDYLTQEIHSRQKVYADIKILWLQAINKEGSVLSPLKDWYKNILTQATSPRHLDASLPEETPTVGEKRSLSVMSTPSQDNPRLPQHEGPQRKRLRPSPHGEQPQYMIVD